MTSGKAIRSVAIAAKEQSRESIHLADELVEWLRRRGVDVFVEESVQRARRPEGVGVYHPGEEVDLVIVLGGDGTLLSMARSLAPGVPILGVNLGSLGFMTEINRSELYPSLIEVLAGQFEIEERSVLEVDLFRASGSKVSYRALNDVVIAKSALARIIQLSVEIGGRHIARYRADGLIVSTPTGSTAYNLSAGGPIVHPVLPVAIITPICPHTLSQRPLVVPDSAEIDITLETAQEEVYLTLDGQEGTSLGYRDRVCVSAAEHKVGLVRVSGRTFFDALRNKLRWGE